MYEEHKEYLFALWRSHQLEHIPHDWNTDWEEFNQWLGFFSSIYHTWGFGWILEHVYYYFGQPIPLLQCDDYIIFKVGGILFVFGVEDVIVCTSFTPLSCQ